MSSASLRETRFSTYLLTWVGLLGLTGLSFAASRLHLGGWDVFVSLVIAAGKSTLVLLIFMHLIDEHFTIRAVVVLSFLLISILIALVAGDVATRKTFPVRPEPPLQDN